MKTKVFPMFSFSFPHTIQHDEASGYTFYNEIDCAN